MFFFTSFSVSTPAAGVSGAGKCGVELREVSFENEFHVLANGAYCHTVNFDALCLQSHQGACADASDRNRVDFAPSKGL
jgi:hypothetical protein